jgi:hypothetical protein
MWDSNRSSNNESNTYCLIQFFGSDLFLSIDPRGRDAVVATENEGCDKAKKFFGFCISCAFLVDRVIKCEESFDVFILCFEDEFVHLFSIYSEVLDAFIHGLHGKRKYSDLFYSFLQEGYMCIISVI